LTLPLATTWTGTTEGIEQSYGGSVAYFSEELWQSGRRHFSIPGGVEPDKIRTAVTATDRVAKRQNLGLKVNDVVILMVARLISWKGHRYAIAAMPHLPENTHLLFVGWGPIAEELQQQAIKLEVADRVHLLGARSDVYELLAVADIYLQTHSIESNGKMWMGPNLYQVEAAAVGVPAVSTAVPLVEYLVEDGVTGTLAKPNNGVDIARAIRWVIDHPEESRIRATAAVIRVGERYTLAHMVDQYERLYSAALGVTH